MSDDWLDDRINDFDEGGAGSRWGDPERDLPRIPEVSTPESGEFDADRQLLTLFWASVVAANVALLGLTLGPMLVFFRGDWKLGGACVAVGAFALYRTSVYCRRAQARGDDGGPDADDSAVGPGEGVED